MSIGNGRAAPGEIRTDPAGNVFVGAPPAEVTAAAPLAGSAVPTAQRLAVPQVQLQINIPATLVPEVMVAIWDVVGEDFTSVINSHIVAQLAPEDLLRLQKMVKDRMDRTGG